MGGQDAGGVNGQMTLETGVHIRQSRIQVTVDARLERLTAEKAAPVAKASAKKDPAAKCST